jgi:hypothetical protein
MLANTVRFPHPDAPFSLSLSWLLTAVWTGATGFIYIGELCRYLYAQPPTPKDDQHSIRFMIGTSPTSRTAHRPNC